MLKFRVLHDTKLTVLSDMYPADPGTLNHFYEVKAVRARAEVTNCDLSVSRRIC